jgi:hypothetical protein
VLQQAANALQATADGADGTAGVVVADGSGGGADMTVQGLDGDDDGDDVAVWAPPTPSELAPGRTRAVPISHNVVHGMKATDGEPTKIVAEGMSLTINRPGGASAVPATREKEAFVIITPGTGDMTDVFDLRFNKDLDAITPGEKPEFLVKMAALLPAAELSGVVDAVMEFFEVLSGALGSAARKDFARFAGSGAWSEDMQAFYLLYEADRQYPNIIGAASSTEEMKATLKTASRIIGLNKISKKEEEVRRAEKAQREEKAKPPADAAGKASPKGLGSEGTEETVFSKHDASAFNLLLNDDRQGVPHAQDDAGERQEGDGVPLRADAQGLLQGRERVPLQALT